MNIHFEEVDPKDLMRSQLNVLRYHQSVDAHRIGTLEGAIRGVIQHLEGAQKVLDNPDSWHPTRSPIAAENTQVIANLKELIGNNQ